MEDDILPGLPPGSDAQRTVTGAVADGIHLAFTRKKGHHLTVAVYTSPSPAFPRGCPKSEDLHHHADADLFSVARSLLGGFSVRLGILRRRPTDKNFWSRQHSVSSEEEQGVILSDVMAVRRSGGEQTWSRHEDSRTILATEASSRHVVARQAPMSVNRLFRCTYGNCELRLTTRHSRLFSERHLLYMSPYSKHRI